MQPIPKAALVVALVLVLGGATAYALGLFEGKAPAADGDAQLNDPRVQAGHLFQMDGGFWVRRRDADAEPLAGPSEELLALPYTAGSEPRHAELGVTSYDEEGAQNGLNLYSSAHAPEALLMDMRGKVLHRWEYDRDRVWPELSHTDLVQGRRYFRRLHLFENGDLLAIYEYTGLIRLDASSKLLWSHKGGNHHDLEVAEDGTILVLGAEKKVVPELREEPVRADNITFLTPDGVEVKRLEIAGCLLASPYSKLIDLARGIETADVFHTNTVKLLDGACAERWPAFRKGNLLVSLRNLGAIGIIDPEKKAFVWAAWGKWYMQHEPVLLPNGNILLFDNRTLEIDRPPSEGSSRVLEYDPLENTIVWEYEGTAEQPFYSRLCGTASRLSGGTTLVSESVYGRVFEITREGEIVWEFRNPHVTGPNDEYVAMIPELIRLPEDFPRWK